MSTCSTLQYYIVPIANTVKYIILNGIDGCLYAYTFSYVDQSWCHAPITVTRERMTEDERRTETRVRIWRTLTKSPPTFVPTIPGIGVGDLRSPPTRAQLRRRERLAPSQRPPRLRGEWMVSMAGLGYHMSVNSDRLMWSAEFDEGDRVKKIVTPRCSAANKRRARLALACTVTVTIILFAAVVQLSLSAEDGADGGTKTRLFTTMTFASISAIARSQCLRSTPG